MPHRLRAINYRVFATLLVVGIPVLLFGSYFVIERRLGRPSLNVRSNRSRPSTPTCIAA